MKRETICLIIACLISFILTAPFSFFYFSYFCSIIIPFFFKYWYLNLPTIFLLDWIFPGTLMQEGKPSVKKHSNFGGNNHE